MSGLSGALIFDEYNYYNGELDLECIMRASSDDERRERKRSIFHTFDTGDYVDFQYYDDPDYVYRAILREPLEFISSRNTRFNETVKILLSYKPFKLNIDQSKTTLTGASKTHQLSNYETCRSKPVITINGSGNQWFEINDKRYNIAGLQNSIVFDSELELVYRNANGIKYDENYKVSVAGSDPELPILMPGVNRIKFSSGVTSVVIEPNWGTII